MPTEPERCSRSWPTVKGGSSESSSVGATAVAASVLVAWTQHGELVAAEPGDGDVGAGRQLEPVGDLAQQLVADVVSEGVVDRLEAVQVDDHDGDAQLRAVPGVSERGGRLV